MRLIRIINEKKFTLVSVFLLLYVALNLFDGERGLISYYEKKELKRELITEKNMLIKNLNLAKKKK